MPNLEQRVSQLEKQMLELLSTQLKVEPPWTKEAFERMAATCGISQKDAEACWSYYDTEGWKLKSGNRIQGDPRSLLIRWSSNPQRLQSDSNAQHERKLSAFDIKDRLAAIQSELAKPCKESDIPRFRELNAEKERLLKARTGISA